MKLFLHIGTEKTGSTSFQRWGRINRQALAAHGVCYSQSLGPENHRKLYLWALPPDQEDDGYAHSGLNAPAARQVFRRTLPGQFAKEVAQARDKGAHSFVISNEHCHSRLTDEAALLRMRDFLAEHFDDIEILCSLRPQIDVAVSLASTWARGFPVTRAFFDTVVPQNVYYNYLALYERWVRVFGAKRITLLPYHRDPDMSRYLLGRLGLPETGLVVPPRQNEALDVRVMALANAIHAAKDKQGKVMLNNMISKLSCTERLQPGLDRAREVQAQFAQSNAALAQISPDLTAEDLEPDWARYNKPPNLYLLDQPCVFPDHLVEILGQYQQQSTLAQARELAATAERALARSNPEAARDFLAQARKQLAALHVSDQDQLAQVEARFAEITAQLDRYM